MTAKVFLLQSTAQVADTNNEWHFEANVHSTKEPVQNAVQAAFPLIRNRVLTPSIAINAFGKT